MWLWIYDKNTIDLSLINLKQYTRYDELPTKKTQKPPETLSLLQKPCSTWFNTCTKTNKIGTISGYIWWNKPAKHTYVLSKIIYDVSTGLNKHYIIYLRYFCLILRTILANIWDFQNIMLQINLHNWFDLFTLWWA